MNTIRDLLVMQRVLSEYVFEPESLTYLEEHWDQVGPLVLDLNYTTADPVAVSREVFKHYFGNATIGNSTAKLIEVTEFTG